MCLSLYRNSKQKIIDLGGMTPVCFAGAKQNDPMTCINAFDGDDPGESGVLHLINKGILKWTWKGAPGQFH